MRQASPAALTSVTMLSARLGVTAKNLRYYEELGLVRSEKLGAHGRGFDEEGVERLTLIIALRSVGVPIETIRAALLRSNRSEATQDAQRLLLRALGDKRATILALEAFIQGAASADVDRACAARAQLETAVAASPSKVREMAPL